MSFDVPVNPSLETEKQWTEKRDSANALFSVTMPFGQFGD